MALGSDTASESFHFDKLGVTLPTSIPWPLVKTIIAVGLCAVFLRILQEAVSYIRVKSLIKNLPGPSNPSWFAGNFPEIYDVTNIKWHHETVHKYGNALRIHGMFGDEQIYLSDPLALHHVILKQANIFEEPQFLLAINRVCLGPGLLSTIGDHHRKQRKILNPAFSIKHHRGLVSVFSRIASKLRDALDEKIVKNGPREEVNILQWAARTTLEFVAQGTCGASLDPLVGDELSDYSKLVKDLVPTVSRLHILNQFLPLGLKFPQFLKTLFVKYVPMKVVKQIKAIRDQLEDTSRTVLETRKNEIARGDFADESKLGWSGVDVLSSIIKENDSARKEDKLEDEEIISQITTIILGAQDTTSSALSRILYTLCLYPEAQNKLRREIREARAAKVDGEDWSYDELMELPFLDAVVRETLRLNSPVSWIWRVARKATTVPLLRPVRGTDGQLITQVPIAKNQGVVIGIAASGRDEATWGPDAWEWKPERWLGNADILRNREDLDPAAYEKMNSHNVKNAWKNDGVKEAKLPGVFSGMMTFSGGGRACIGFKFALLSLKTLLSMLVERYEFELPEEEIGWNMNHIQAPVIKGKEGESPRLPLKISFAK